MGGVEPAPAPAPAPASTAEAKIAGTGEHRLRFGYLSIVGDYREHNEDNLHIPSTAAPENRSPRKESKGPGGNYDTTLDYEPVALEPKDRLFIVADGMGGQNAGEHASKMAVDIIPQEVERRLSRDEALDEKAVANAIRDSMAEANKHILALSHLQSEYANMGTTAVLCLFRDNHAYIANLGDSRAYRLRGGELKQLTKDHSLADALVGAGTITPDELENHRFKHVLYLYLGSKEARSGPEEVQVLDVRRGDRFLLASDGLTGVVKLDELAQVLLANDDPQKAAEELVERARKNISKDNITSIVIYVV